MARSTVSDCLELCPNHFELVTGVADRARKIKETQQSRFDDEISDKEIVAALREVASGQFHVDLEEMVRAEQQAHFDEQDAGQDPRQHKYLYPDDDSSPSD